MATSEQRVSLSVDGAVATVTIMRPHRMNAFDYQTLRDLVLAFGRVQTNPAVRAMVLTGSGRAFSAGGDVKEWAEETEERLSEFDEDWTVSAHRMMAKLYRLPKPVVAAVNGWALGAGLDLALACDFRYASPEARFGSVYIRLGYPPDVGASFLLPRVVGVTKAKELIYTGRIVEPEEALRIGLIEKVVETDDLVDEAKAFAAELASGPTVAIGLAKEVIQSHLSESSIETALANEHRSAKICANTEDHREGMAASSEKREPRFVGR